MALGKAGGNGSRGSQEGNSEESKEKEDACRIEIALEVQSCAQNGSSAEYAHGG